MPDWSDYEVVDQPQAKPSWEDFEPVTQSSPPVSTAQYVAGGGPMAGMAMLPSLYRTPSSPIVDIPDIEAKTALGQAGAELVNIPKNIALGATSPVGLSMLATGPVGIAAGIGMGVKSVGHGLRQVYEGAALGDMKQVVKGAAEALSAGILTGGPGPKLLKDILPSKVEGVRPAVKTMDEELIPGDKGQTHNEIIKDNDLKPEDINRRTFVDTTGEATGQPGTEISRQELGQVIPTELPNKEAHSTDLAAAQEEQTPPSALPAGAKQGEAPVSAAVEGGVQAPPTPQAMPEGGTPQTPTQAPSVTEGVTQPELVGMGGAVPGEFIGSAGADVYGVAQRVREERAAAGQTPSIQPGQGVSDIEAVQHGRALLSRDPLAGQKAVDAFNKTKAVSYDGIAVARAKGEEAAQAARSIESKFGTDSKEYQNAFENLANWDKSIKEMQTEWHKSGQAQQGQTDIDTGDFTSMQRAYHDATGKTFSEGQRQTADRLVKTSQKATQSVSEAKGKLFKTLDVAEIDPKVKSLADRIVATLDKGANDALARIKARRAEGRLFTGIDPAELADYAIYGASKIAKGAVEFSKWSADMVKDIGDYIKPHLKQIWDASNKHLDEQVKGAPEVVKQAVRKTLVTLEGVRGAVADHQTGKSFEPTQVKAIWNYAKTNYIDKGINDFTDLVQGVATDLGLNPNEVRSALAQPKGARKLTDEMYAKMSAQRRVQNQAKAWVKDQQVPGWLRFMRSVPRVFFIDKIFGHGTVGMITHAGLNMFNPGAWRTYWPNFFRQYGLVFKPAYHERMMQELARDPNFIKARRAGLANDPNRFSDDYQNAAMKTFLGKFSGLVGNRGFDALKLFRQARFNQIWNGLPETIRNNDMAKMVADDINHATGVVAMPFREWTGWTFFAPKLEGSRWAWMLADPAKAAKTFKEWKTATPEEQAFAMSQLKQKAAIAGTYATLLALNQGLLSASGSKEKINFTNPRKSDFLSFKVAGHNVGIVSPLLGMVRLFANLAHDAFGKRGKLESLTPRGGQIAEDLGSYARGKLSPFAGQAYNILSQSDFQGRPLPFSTDRVPAYLKKRGVGRYTYPEYLAQELAPIPVEEAIKEVWSNQGMTATDMDKYLTALLVGVAAGGTGARVSKDYNVK